MNSIENQAFGGYRNLPILPPSEVIRPPKGCIGVQEIRIVGGGNVFVMQFFGILFLYCISFIKTTVARFQNQVRINTAV